VLQKIRVDDNVRSVLEEDIHPSLIQQRSNGMQMLSYVSGNFVIDQLNRAFNYAWSWSIDKTWVQPSVDKPSKTGGAPVAQPPVAHVIGTLTVFLKDDNGNMVSVSKTGAGSKILLGGSSEQESCIKAAATDSLKKAASLFGIGAQLYRDPTEQAFFKATLGQDFWDDTTMAELDGALLWLEDCKKEQGWDTARVNAIVTNWSGQRYNDVKLLPSYLFAKFVKFLQKEARNAKKQSQTKQETKK